MNALNNYLRNLKYSDLNYFKKTVYLKQKFSGGLYNRDKNGVILNCGGPRSGSTMLNIIIKEVLIIGLKSDVNYLDNPKDLSSELSNYSHYTVIKTHRYFANIQRLIKRGQVIGFMTHRDIRDVAVSLKQKGWVKDIKEFVESKELKNIIYSSMAYANMLGMNVISYKELTEQPKEVILKVARALDIKLSQEEIEAIVQFVSPSNLSKTIDSIPKKGESEDSHDLATGLHKDHIKDGKTGKWRNMLSETEANAITAECTEYFNLFNY